jgi:hypothetical protein
VCFGQGYGFLIYPLALFWVHEIGRNAKFLLTLGNKKKPLAIAPGDHRLVG